MQRRMRTELDYALCRYGGSRLLCRGPRRNLAGDYIAVLGGIETFGRYVQAPYPALLERHLSLPCVNLGVPQVGPDAVLGDPALLEVCRGARVTVLQVPGAHMLQNRFYRVHSRRNDRVIAQGAMLHAVYPQIDFSQFAFVRHMLLHMEQVGPARFTLIRDDLRRVWLDRVNQLCQQIGGPVVLMWMGARSPDGPADSIADGDPPFVTRQMLQSLRGRIVGLAELATPPGRRGTLTGKVYTEAEAWRARLLPGPVRHAEAARLLADIIAPMVPARGPVQQVEALPDMRAAG